MRSAKGVAKRSPQDTITAIVAAAAREFGLRGLEGARMESIARRCGKTKQLIYHYYGSKERLFAEVVSKNHEAAVADLMAHDYDGMEPEDAFRALLFNMADQYRRFPGWASMMLDENLQGGVHYAERSRLRAATRPLVSQFQRILDRGSAAGLFAPDVDADKFYAAAFSLVTACFMTGRVMSEYLTVDMRSAEGVTEWVEYAVGLLLASIRPHRSLTGGQKAPLDKMLPARPSAVESWGEWK